jgi:hypothetical protein
MPLPDPPHDPRAADPRLPHALEYLNAGWPVFVLGRTKRPVANCRACSTASSGHDPQACGCLTCHGFYAATCDPDRVRAMLAAVPRGLLALRTGAVSDRVVIDIDPRDGGRLDPQIMSPTAAVAAGGADGGWHLHYRHPGGYVPSRKLPGHPGVDVKGDGGYVVLPPSVHPVSGRPYRWAHDREMREMHPALADLCRTPARISPPAPPGLTPAHHTRQPPAQRHPTPTGGGCISSPDALLAAHLDAVARAPEGRRRRTLYGAARGIARMVAAGAITEQRAWDELTAAGLAAGQSRQQTRNAINGAFTAEGLAPCDPR